MATFTVVEIIERARSASDMVGSNFVTPTEWLRWLNVENRWLAKYLARNGYVWSEGREDLDASTDISSTGFASIPDPIAITGVYELSTSTGAYRRLRADDVIDKRDVVTTGQADFYTVVQNGDETGIRFWPIPTSGLYQIFTIPEPATVGIDDDVIYPSSIEERLVLGLARRALAKEDSDVRDIDKQIVICEREIEEFCWDRTIAAHQKIRNVDRVERGWQREPQLMGSDRWLWV